MEKITLIILAYFLLSVQPDVTITDKKLNSQCSDEKIIEILNLRYSEETYKGPVTLIENEETFCWEGPVPTENCFEVAYCRGGEAFCTGLCTTVEGCSVCFPCYYPGDPFPEEHE